MEKTTPIKHQNYTLKQVFESLNLQKPPALMTLVEGRHDNFIQHNHVTQQTLLATPGWADSLWTFLYETSDHIAVFRSGEDVAHLVEAKIDWTTEDPSAYWVTPVNFPLSQLQ